METALVRGVLTVLVTALVAGSLSAAEPEGTSAESRQAFVVTGMGGAGGMYTPSVSPFDPNLMLISCDMGGAYRSLDGGKHWELIPFKQLGGSLSCRPAFLPDAVFWVGGNQLRMSRDKAATWLPVLTGTAPWQSGPITCLATSAADPPVLFVGTETGLWRPADSGKTWEQGPAGKCTGIVALGTKVFAAVQSEGKVLARSLDGGKTWESLAVAEAKGNPLSSLTGGAAAGAGEVLFASVAGVGIIRSADGGSTWTVADQDRKQNDVLMAANQTQVAYAANRSDILRTTDGGKSWANCFRMTGEGANVERSWVQTEIKWGYGISPLGLGGSASDPKLVMVTTQGDFYVSRDGGEHWYQSMNEPVGVKPGDPGFRYRSTGLEVTSCWHYYFDPADHDRRYIAYTDIGFARSVDGGDTWVYSAQGCPWANTFYQVAFDPTVKGKMYAATSSRHDIPHWTHISPNSRGHSGGVCVSEDGGVSWKVLGQGQPAQPCTSIAIDPKSPPGKLTLYATYYEGGVYKSTDGGATWVKKSEGLGNPGNLHALSVTVHPKTGDLYCGITANRQDSTFPVPGGIWKSTDGGETWADITSELKLAWPANFTVHPENPEVIYLTAATIPNGRIGGVYKTTDGGKSWTRILKDEDFAAAGGAGYVHCLFINLHPDKRDYVYLGTGSHGLWMSPDAGKTWKLFENFPFRSVTNVTFDPADRTVMYVTTFGGGVWRGNYLP